MRYPINIQAFETIREGGYVYVDKTDLVYDLAQEHVCLLSRPPKFGKSLLISTLEAYFLGRRELFAGLKIDELEHDWDVYPVFHMDFSNVDFTKPDALNNILNGYLTEWEAIYGSDPIRKTLGDRFRYVIEQARNKTGKHSVVLIDEYDKPMLDVLGGDLEKINRNILNGFLGTFKAADASIRFVLLTGVTNFSLATSLSGFNQAHILSMHSHYDAICGITEDELHTVFAEPIREMAAKFGYDEEGMKAVLKKQYGGYHFSSSTPDIYNPFSIINAFSWMKLENYWYRSAIPTYLARLVDTHNINMQKLAGRDYDSQYFMYYYADIQDPLSILYQIGYLTIKDYELRYSAYTLDFPNDEVRSGLLTLTANGYFNVSEADISSWILGLNDMLRRCDLDEVRDAFTSFLASIPYEANKDVRALNFETHFQYTFYLINRLLGCYTTLIEKQNSKGKADIIIESDNDIYIFEFKVDGTADEALKQIEDKQYALPYLTDPRPLHKIGVTISSQTRTVAEWKVAC